MGEWLENSLSQVIATLESGTRPKGGATTESGEVPSLGGENIIQAGGVSLHVMKKVPISFYEKMTKGYLQEGDVLINKDGANTGKLGIFKGFNLKRACINEHLFLIRSNEDIDNSFLYYFLLLESTQQIIKNRISGSAQPGLNSSFVKNFPFRYPRIKEEQTTIATILTTIDQAIEKTEQLIAKYERTKTGLMQDLLTRGIDEHRNIRTEETHEFKDSGLGRIPREWQIGTIGDFCFVTKLAGFEFTNYIRYIEDGEIIALRALNIKNEKLVLDDIQRISKKVSDLLTRSKLYAGDILITYIGAYIGDVLQIRENDKYHLAPNIAKIVPPKYIVNDFFEMYLRSYPIQIQMKNVTVTTATPSLTMKQIRNLTVAFPNDEYEQNRIVDAINTVNHTLRSNEENYRNLKMLKTGLMQDLLTGKVRVDSLI